MSTNPTLACNIYADSCNVLLDSFPATVYDASSFPHGLSIVFEGSSSQGGITPTVDNRVSISSVAPRITVSKPDGSMEVVVDSTDYTSGNKDYRIGGSLDNGVHDAIFVDRVRQTVFLRRYTKEIVIRYGCDYGYNPEWSADASDAPYLPINAASPFADAFWMEYDFFPFTLAADSGVSKMWGAKTSNCVTVRSYSGEKRLYIFGNATEATGYIDEDGDYAFTPNGMQSYLTTNPITLRYRLSSAVDEDISSTAFGQALLALRVDTQFSVSGTGLAYVKYLRFCRTPATAGKTAFVFGDSITETATADSEGAMYFTAMNRENWGTYSRYDLRLGGWYNWAKTGASITDYTSDSHSTRQWLSEQVAYAVTPDNEVTPDLIIVAIGSTDVNKRALLGSFDTAMSKATLSELDRTLIYEALRYNLWTLRFTFPRVPAFFVMPIQRADFDNLGNPKKVEPWLREAIAQMAREYDFTIIDAYSESGIVRDVEKASSIYLNKGFNPNSDGSKKLSELITNAVLRAMPVRDYDV